MSTSIKLSSSRRGSRKKTPFEVRQLPPRQLCFFSSFAPLKQPFPLLQMAEDCVKKAFEFEDMNWNVLAAWAKEVFGGFGEKALDLLGMSANEVLATPHHTTTRDIFCARITLTRH